ncbi:MULTISPECIES: Ku protein [unclassified Rhizobium]|uniref:non-homologous end joining protein Ku n=1 Tax=unclassified Rhizobium TaxID=2613769 RepID=UPI0016170388|nr:MULTISPECIES: Ku protein [unclassified Rhizobium]MBB3285320.1 DNA end-binding protein Ku [Rhizobium sp. BK252]MBB3400059.1 DNA end-binding protein Ku [Rhizobium sp. BK289]MBB3412639.1 DNA end-binding protein Ku [Rhizobium sp. BK284]MBB3480525.1 DNA end-binding protein Ku [Rhizobium sp. BK347]MDK4719190.1 Ku protein [Rhizobium sp. CNPSo 3968]
MSPRAQWKGYLKFGEVSCAVALYTAVSTSERISFHTLNRETGNRVRREFIDSQTEKPVPRDDQVKGYELNKDDYIVLEPEEVAAAVPESDKVLHVKAFLACSDIDDVYFDRPYYLAPSSSASEEAFALIREGMHRKKVAAIAQAVLFRRLRTLMIRPHGKGLIATTLNFDYEVRSAKEAFEDVPDMKIKGEMLELAKHIIATKEGSFDAAEFEDRYEAALTELVKAKVEGRAIPKREPAKIDKVTDLMEALRQSAGADGRGKASAKRASQKAGSASRKAEKSQAASSSRSQRKAG